MCYVLKGVMKRSGEMDVDFLLKGVVKWMFVKGVDKWMRISRITRVRVLNPPNMYVCMYVCACPSRARAGGAKRYK